MNCTDLHLNLQQSYAHNVTFYDQTPLPPFFKIIKQMNNPHPHTDNLPPTRTCINLLVHTHTRWQTLIHIHWDTHWHTLRHTHTETDTGTCTETHTDTHTETAQCLANWPSSFALLDCGVTGMRAWRSACSQCRACSRPLPLSVDATMLESSWPYVMSSPTQYVSPPAVWISNTWGARE